VLFLEESTVPWALYADIRFCSIGRLKMREWKMRKPVAGVVIAGVENGEETAGVENAGVSRMKHQIEIVLRKL